MPELDEWKTPWQQQNQLLEQSIRLNRELFSSAKLNSAEHQLRRAALYAGFEAALWLLIVVALGNFIALHTQTPALAWSAAATDAMSIGMTIALIRRITAALQIDYAQPVAAIQKQVEAILILRIRTTQYSLLGGTLLWLPWLAVVAHALFGINLYYSLNPVWLLANVLFGLAVFPGAVWVSRRYANRLDRSPFMQRLTRDLAGNNLNAAHAFLAKLRYFEADSENLT